VLLQGVPDLPLPAGVPPAQGFIARVDLVEFKVHGALLKG
jgi:hypothetical protein